jgi:hypothetical protein
MKIVSVIILIALCIASLSPWAVVRVSSGSQTVSIKTLDVCHQADGIVLNNPDLPFVSEDPCAQARLSIVNFFYPSNSAARLPLITIPIELPPKV